MYVKLFAKITNSSIWREDHATIRIWITLLAMADKNGFVEAATIWNVARVANATEAEATAAISILESPDPDSSDPDNNGRRIERVQGGWVIHNYLKYRSYRDEESRREYKASWMRESREAKPKPKAKAKAKPVKQDGYTADFELFWAEYPKRVGKSKAFDAWSAALLKATVARIVETAKGYRQFTVEQKTEPSFIKHPSTWLNQGCWDDEYQLKPVVYLGEPDEDGNIDIGGAYDDGDTEDTE